MKGTENKPEASFETERRKHVEEGIRKAEESTDMNRMGIAPVGKLLLEMSWPAVLSMTINALYNLVDSIFVGMLSQSALTAISLVMPMQMLMISLNVGSGVGVNSLIARRLGARRYEEADQAAGTSLRIGVMNWLIFAVIGLLLARPFMAGYTDDPQIYRYGVSYFMIVSIGSLFSALDLEIEKVLQSTGNMIAPMIISLSGAITNIILDPIFIFGLLGAPRLEVAGAAIATVAGQFVSMVMAFWMFFRKEHDVKIQIRGFHLDWKVVRDIYAVGLPSIIMQSIGSFMLLGYNRILAASATAVAVLGVYFKLQSFVFMPVFGMNQGAMPIMGFNFGARNRERLMKTYKLGVIAAAVIMGIGLILFQVFPAQFLKMFSASDAMMEMGIPALRVISLCFLPASFGILSSTLFQATGHGVYSLFASLLRQLLGILPIAYILYRIGGASLSWFSFPLAEVIGLIYSAVMVVHLYRKEIKTL